MRARFCPWCVTRPAKFLRCRAILLTILSGYSGSSTVAANFDSKDACEAAAKSHEQAVRQLHWHSFKNCMDLQPNHGRLRPLELCVRTGSMNEARHCAPIAGHFGCHRKGKFAGGIAVTRR